MFIVKYDARKDAYEILEKNNVECITRLEFIRTRERMCKKYYTNECVNCPIKRIDTEYDSSDCGGRRLNDAEFLEIIFWGKTNPIVTNFDVFKCLFPKANTPRGIIETCPAVLDITYVCESNIDCIECMKNFSLSECENLSQMKGL